VSVELWLGFVVAAEIILVIPGPTILLVISHAVVHGRRSAVPLTAGVVAGDLTAMTLSLAGLGMLMTVSAALFSVFKWIGAGYLVFLGVRMWRQDGGGRRVADGPSHRTADGALFRSAWVVTALNPKSIAFFVAFLPQFVAPSCPVLPQFATLGSTFLLLAGINAALYGLFAGQLQDVMQRPDIQRWFRRCGATVLIGAGAFTAGLRQ
jgi:threonine/homoserine/homoserine lactone efflux protein